MMPIQIIQARPRDLGDGFMVRRLLPAIGHKMVGPFIFFDHMGPVEFLSGQGLDVRPHPHINLATVTYLFDGEIMHRDSLGSAQVICPGDINWMTAGCGIVHSERTPPEARQRGARLEGIQCWVALPREHEETEPTFVHHPGGTIPRTTIDGVEVRILVGTAFGLESPVASFSDIVYLDVKMPAGSRFDLPSNDRELAAYGVQGEMRIDGREFPERALAIASGGAGLTIEASSESRIMIIGGQGLPEKREIWWNFVSSSKERIDRAKADWVAGLFPKVPGDEVEFIPLPPDPPLRRGPEGTVM